MFLLNHKNINKQSAYTLNKYICKIKFITIKLPEIKMKQSKLFYTAIFAITSLAATAQINQTPMTAGGNQIVGNKEKAMATKGSMYLNEQFMPAKITDNPTPVLLRYNAYSDYFEMNNPQEQKSQILQKQAGKVITFVNNGEEYTFVNYINKDKEDTNGYLNIITESAKVKIYKKERIFLQPGLIADNSYQTSKPAMYKKAGDEFFIQLGNAKEAAYFSGKKELAKLAPEKSKEILEYIKTNKIDVEEVADLQKLGNYLQTIL